MKDYDIVIDLKGGQWYFAYQDQADDLLNQEDDSFEIVEEGCVKWHRMQLVAAHGGTE